MPPFTTVNGQTGYYLNGQFVPATQQEYDAFFNSSQQGFSNPYLSQVQQPQTNRTEYVTQGTIQSPQTATMSNEQKIMQNQGNEAALINNPTLGVTSNPKPQATNPNIANQNLNQNINSFFQNAFGQVQAMRQTQQKPYSPTGNVIPQGPPQSELMSNPLVQGANDVVFKSPFINPAAPTISAAPTQQINMPEISSTATNAISSAGNKIGSQVGSTVSDVVDKGLKSDVLGSGKLGFSGKEFFKSDAGKTTSAIAGAGVGLVSGLVKAGAPDKYDQRVGMSKPNLGGNLFGDATFTQMGLNPGLMAATGGISALVGGGVDLVKNIVKYSKQKDRYENKKLATDTMQSIDDSRENMKPDYTGYARFGTQVKNPYLNKYNNGGKVIVDGKEISIDSDEYRKLYNTGDLMNVDEQGMPARLSTEELVITAPMTDQERKNREIQKERDAQGLNYNWSTGSQNPYTSQIQNTVLHGINYTIPSVPEFQPIFNPEDDYLKDYVGKSLGEHPFIFNNTAGVGMGYNHFGNNAWMSTGLGTVDDSPTIMGHLADRYGTTKAYEASKQANDIPSLYIFYKDLSKEKNWQEDIGVSATKYYDNLRELTDMGDYLEREGRFIDDIVKKQGYGHNLIMDENGNKLIRNFTADKDKFMGSVTLTPEMYKVLLEAPDQKEAKRRLMKMAKIPQDVDMDKLFIHMNLSRPKNLSSYLKAKTVNPNSVRNWHDTPTGNIYINRVKQEGRGLYNTTKYRIGGIVQNPYLNARSGIYIKPENRGKFTSWAEDHNMGVQQAANKVMANKEEYNPSVVKMANFAKNASKWGRFGMETDPIKKKANETDIVDDASLESTGPESDNLEMISKDAYNTMQSIYNSKGYKRKLANELKQSNKMSEDEKLVYRNPFAPELQQTKWEVYKNDIDNLYFGKPLLDRRKESLDIDISYMDKDDPKNDTSFGYYRPDLKSDNNIGDRLKMLHQFNPYIKISKDSDHKYYTLIEELEHASHYPAKGTAYGSESFHPSGQNITPYAQKILKENINLNYEDDPYLTTLSEAIAKKRATEAYLIENNLLKPGENVNKSHYDFLEKNYTKLPSNVQSMFDMTDESILDKMGNRKISVDKLQKKRRQNQYTRFENIMNKIAMQQNPYTNEPIS